MRPRLTDTTTFADPRLKSQFSSRLPTYPSGHRMQRRRSGQRLTLNNVRTKDNAKSLTGLAALPEKIGKYVIINEVGRGSTGVVYL